MNILIADDNAANLKLLRTTLEAVGHTVVAASDGAEALGLLDREHVDAVISDILMPRMDGYRFCLEVRKKEEFKALPFIFYTETYTSPGDAKAALEVGADDFLRKPGSASELLHALEEAVKNPGRRQPQAVGLPAKLELMKEYNARLVAKLEKKNLQLQAQAESLRQSEAHNRAILDSALDCIIVMDHQGKILEFNPAAEKTFGFTRAEALGQDMAELIIPPSLREAHRRGLERAHARLEGRAVGRRLEMTALRKAGGEFPAELTITQIAGTEPPVFTWFIRDITERKRAEEEGAKSRAQLRALAARLQAAREEERIRISREIHDDLGELLTGLKLGLSWIRTQLEAEELGQVREELREKIAMIGALADGTANRVRKLCTELRPSVLDDLGLVPAIEWQTREFEARTNIRCETRVELENFVASREQATALFRIFQEILTNVSRHAQASKVRVALSRRGSNLLLKVKDNGRGITTEELANTNSLGLLGMKERAALFGGKGRCMARKAKAPGLPSPSRSGSRAA